MQGSDGRSRRASGASCSTQKDVANRAMPCSILLLLVLAILLNLLVDGCELAERSLPGKRPLNASALLVGWSGLER